MPNDPPRLNVALQAAEKLWPSRQKCQGTTSVVPKMPQIDVGFSPCGHSIRHSRMRTELFRSLFSHGLFLQIAE
jgi:hypothetical protein